MQASGVILAGGRSSRMKSNKALAKIEGQTVINIIADKFSRVFDERIIITNESLLFSEMGLRVHTDIYPGLGPVSGIHSALYHASNDTIFVLGCDLPFMDMELAKYLLARLDNYDSVVPDTGSQLQPLAAVYSRKCLPVFSNCLKNDKLKLTRIFEELNTLVIPRAELEKFGEIEEIFFNINDAKALDRAVQFAGRYLR